MLAKPNNSIAVDTLVSSKGIQSTIINGSISPEDDVAKSYDLEINIVDVIPEEDSDDTIPEAIATELDSLGESATFSEEIDVGRDIDIYQLQLGTGDGLILDIKVIILHNQQETQRY